jgi:hypothetical protein
MEFATHLSGWNSQALPFGTSHLPVHLAASLARGYLDMEVPLQRIVEWLADIHPVELAVIVTEYCI